MNSIVRRIIVCCTVLIGTTVQAQSKFKPSVVVTYPGETTMSEEIAGKLEEYITEVEITPELKKDFVKDDLPLNWKLTREKELDFIQKQDFFALLTLAVSRQITYKEIDYHSNTLIYPTKEVIREEVKNVKLPYKDMANRHKVSWIVNLVKAELRREGTNNFLTVHYKVYNQSADRFFIDKTISVESAMSPDTCSDNTWDCLIELIKMPIAEDIVHHIEKNGQYH